MASYSDGKGGGRGGMERTMDLLQTQLHDALRARQVAEGQVEAARRQADTANQHKVKVEVITILFSWI